jgi:antitoxin component YwqK of YwqJK toxin-antitoxin module
MHFFRSSFILLVLLWLTAGACTRKTVSFNSKPDQPSLTALSDSLVQNSDTTGGQIAKQVTLTKAEAKAAREKEKAAQRKPKKKKNIFLGEPIKKAYVKSGPKGRNQITEQFYYMRTPKPTNPYVPVRYYFDAGKGKIVQDRVGAEPGNNKVLHGPYKKMQGGKVVETGYFALGAKHLRWERLNREGILLNKIHYEKGFPRDADITYYDAERTKIKEIIPYNDGKLEGEYARFLENGQKDWDGQFENGKKVGEWAKYWGFRNRRHYEYQYGETGYDPEVKEPVLYKEYNRNGVLVYEKDKLDKRDAVTDRPGLKKN